MARSVHRRSQPAGGNGWQNELPPSQLTLNFEPALPERFPSLREFVAFRVQEQRLHAATLAAKMDLSPTTLSRKLSQKDGDANRFNLDDLEAYCAATDDVMAVIEYLAAKYAPGAAEARRTRALARAEQVLCDLPELIAALRGEG
jgi:hypothetical protein